MLSLSDIEILQMALVRAITTEETLERSEFSKNNPHIQKEYTKQIKIYEGMLQKLEDMKSST